MANRKFLQRWYWVTVGVFVLGALSVAMLLWTNNIYERQRANLALTSALMDVRIKTATFHLWLEEALTGDTTIDVQKLLSDLDLAIDLTSTILDGGAIRARSALEASEKFKATGGRGKNSKPAFRIQGDRLAANPGPGSFRNRLSPGRSI